MGEREKTMGGGRASMKASTSKRKKTRGMKRKKSENSSFPSFPSSSKSSKSLSFEVKKRWRKVQVDPDALLEDTDQDWGGFLELEVLEDCGDEEMDREKKREEEKEKADEKDV